MTVSVVMLFSACQSSTHPPSEPSASERTNVVASYSVYSSEPQKIADSVTWVAGQYSGGGITPVVRSQSGGQVTYAASISMPAALGSQPLAASLWKCGVRIIRSSYSAVGVSDELTLTAESILYDQFALTLLDSLIRRGTPLSRTNLVALYASWLLAGDKQALTFPDSIPVGLSQQEVIQAVLVAASKVGSPLAKQAKSWSLDISLDSARTLTLQLLATSQIPSADSAKLFPPPTIRVDVPLSVATGLVVAGNPVAVGGSFIWNKGLGEAALRAYVLQGSVLVKPSLIAVIGIPTPEAHATHASFDSSATTLFANTTALEGDYQLVVIAQLANGDSAKATANFHVGPKEPAKPLAPSLQLIAPLDNATLPFDSSRVTTRWRATTPQGNIDSVVVNGVAATGHDSIWTCIVALDATGKPTTIAAKAKNSDGLWTTVGATLHRAIDTTHPVITKIVGGRILTYDSLVAPVSWQVEDNDQIAIVHIQGVEAKGNDGVYSATPALRTGDNMIRIDATDRQGNVARDSALLHVVSPVRITRIAPASDSQESQTGAILVSWVVRNAKSVSIGGQTSISPDSVYSAHLTLSGTNSAVTLTATDSSDRRDSSRVLIFKRLQTPLEISYAPQTDPDSVTVIAVSDTGATFSYSLDGKTWTPCPAIFPQKTSGTIRVKAHVAGNTDSIVTGASYELYHANHAPVIVLSSSSPTIKSYQGSFKFPAASVSSWGTGDSTQTGTWEVQQQLPADSQFLTGLSMTTDGHLGGSLNLDTSISLNVRFRIKDNGGTARGGVDTSDWSDWLSLRIADTVLDAQGNAYRARRMPDGEVWMRENLRTVSPFGDTAWAQDTLHSAGRNYTWAQAMSLDQACDTATCKPFGVQRGLCPSGWHIADTAEWSLLTTSIGESGSIDSVGLRKLRAGSNWRYMYTQRGSSGTINYPATDDYGFGIHAVHRWGGGSVTGDVSLSYSGAAYWTRNGLMKLQTSLQIHQEDDGRVSRFYNTYSSNGASVRCLMN
jgi:uncharacterized protein (TIGR02145 family)